MRWTLLSPVALLVGWRALGVSRPGSQGGQADGKVYEGEPELKPYYNDERSGITIYHGDCREILPSLSADVIVTDPPYNAPDIGPNHRPGIGGGLDAESYSAFCREWFGLASAITSRIIFSPGLVHLWEYPKARWVICWHKPSSVSFTALGGYNTWEPILVYGKLPKGQRIIHDHVMYVPMNFITDEWAKHPCPKTPLS
jgi:hypothetical protein